jgi:hypothetical protein
MRSRGKSGRWDDDIVALSHEVGTDWTVIDREWERLRDRYEEIHLRRDASRSSLEFLREALQITKGRHLLPVFGAGLIAAGAVSKTFEKLLRDIVGEPVFELEAFQNGRHLPTLAFEAGIGLLDSCERVCRIDVSGQHSGTGVLVRPTLVATALHVVRKLVECDGDQVRAVPGSADELTLTFGYLEDYLPTPIRPAQLCGISMRPHEDWLAWGSKQTLNEELEHGDVRDVCGITEADGPWDLAIIRLASPRRIDRMRQIEHRPPREPFQIHVLHHPGTTRGDAEPLLWSIGVLDQQLGLPAAVRYLHDANTSKGSSGAPVFDRQWRVVALHQAGERNDVRTESDASAVAAEARNRAVPVYHWMRRLDQLQWAPGAVPLLRDAAGPDGKRGPVVGMLRTQERLWQATRPDARPEERLLIVRGEPGLGLPYIAGLASEYVRAHSGALVAVLDVANALNTDASGFAGRIIGAFSGAPGDVPPTGDSTRQNDIRTSVAPALASDLEKLSGAERRPVWIVLDGFDRAKVSDQQGVDNLLLMLINLLPERRFLRLVMIGWQQIPPEGFAGSVEDLVPATAPDVARAAAEPGREPSRLLVLAAPGVLDAVVSAGKTGHAAAVEAAQKLRQYAAEERDGAR